MNNKTIDIEAFLQALPFLTPPACCSHKRYRVYMAGILFTENRCIATDGQRLHSAPVCGPEGLFMPYPVMRAIAATRPKTLEVTEARDQVILCGTTEDYVLKLQFPRAGDQFPPWKQVIPSTYEHTLTVPAKDLQKALKGFEDLVRVHVDHEHKLWLSNDDVERCEVPTGKGSQSESYAFTCDPTFLCEALRCCKDAKISYISAQDPICITAQPEENDAPAFAILMPMRD